MAFKEIYDALTRGSILDDAFDEIEEMNEQSKSMFRDSFKCLLDDKCNIAERICGEDKLINRLEVQVRTKVLKYLAFNTSPDLSGALYLISIVIDYERIGDYCKNIAQLKLLYPTILDDDQYRKDVIAMYGRIIKMFDLTKAALQEDDEKKAKTVMGMHEEGTKRKHADLARRLTEDKEIDARKAIIYALLTNNLRRISAHLRNVASGVIQPIPQLGYNPFKEEMRKKRKEKEE
jgi:phosphate uptake regulator